MNDFERLIASSLQEVERSVDDGTAPDRVHIERALKKHRRRRVSAGLAGASMAVAAIALATSYSRLVPARSLPVSGESVSVPITRNPASPDITAIDGTVWFSSPSEGRLVHLDADGRQLTSVDLAGAPADIEVAFGRMWIADPAAARIVQVDLATGAESGFAISLGVTPGPIELSADDEALWAVLEGSSVMRVDPSTGAVRKVPVSGRPIDVAARGGTVWVLQDDGTIVSIDRTTLAAGERVIHVSASTEGDITVGAEHLWYGIRGARKVVRIDPTGATERVVIHLSGTYRRIAVQPDVAWVISVDNQGLGLATPLSPYEGTIAGPSISLPAEPSNVAIAATKAWVSFREGAPLSFARAPQS